MKKSKHTFNTLNFEKGEKVVYIGNNQFEIVEVVDPNPNNFLVVPTTVKENIEGLFDNQKELFNKVEDTNQNVRFVNTKFIRKLDSYFYIFDSYNNIKRVKDIDYIKIITGCYSIADVALLIEELLEKSKNYEIVNHNLNVVKTRNREAWEELERLVMFNKPKY